MNFIYRTAASFVASRAALEPRRLLTYQEMIHPGDANQQQLAAQSLSPWPEAPSKRGYGSGRLDAKQRLDSSADFRSGGLIVVGSYVPKTTAQLSHLLSSSVVSEVLVDASEIIRAAQTKPSKGASSSSSGANEPQIDAVVGKIIAEASATIDAELRAGRDVVLYPSREFAAGAQLADTAAVSAVVTGIISRLLERPHFVICKGGITSFDVARVGLCARSARVLGQVEPGVPVWQLDNHSKFPGVPFIVFPGNVGSDDALTRVARKLKTKSRPQQPIEPEASAVRLSASNATGSDSVGVEYHTVVGAQGHGGAAGINVKKWSSNAASSSRWTGKAGLVSALLAARQSKKAIAAFNICMWCTEFSIQLCCVVI